SYAGVPRGDNPSRRSTHAETVAAGAAALFVAASPLAHAQTSSAATVDRLKTSERLSQTDRNALTDLRIDLVKGALQLTPEQQKYWPPVENAIRARAEDRRDRFAKIAETMGKRADESPAEVMGNRDPIAFLQRRAEALAQRSADLNKLAEAWQPLYKTLSPEQRQRMAALAILYSTI
ncbi:MAG: Spy/CpxP family protein refolding chaperone, partial [Pseudolabrys sp.]